MTPYDVKVKGTFAEPPKKEKLPPRKPTSEEQRAILLNGCLASS